jgi:hypothetical protein
MGEGGVPLCAARIFRNQATSDIQQCSFGKESADYLVYLDNGGCCNDKMRRDYLIKVGETEYQVTVRSVRP